MNAVPSFARRANIMHKSRPLTQSAFVLVTRTGIICIACGDYGVMAAQPAISNTPPGYCIFRSIPVRFGIKNTPHRVVRGIFW